MAEHDAHDTALEVVRIANARFGLEANGPLLAQIDAALAAFEVCASKRWKSVRVMQA